MSKTGNKICCSSKMIIRGILSKNWPKSVKNACFLPRYLGCEFPPPQFQWQMDWVINVWEFPQKIRLFSKCMIPGDESWNHPKTSHNHFLTCCRCFFHGVSHQIDEFFRLLCNVFNGSPSPSASRILSRSLSRVYVGLHEDWDPWFGYRPQVLTTARWSSV